MTDILFAIPSETGTAIAAGDVEPTVVARLANARLPGSDLPFRSDLDVFDLPGPAFLLVTRSDDPRTLFTGEEGLDELADQVVDGDAEIDGVFEGPFRDRLEKRYMIVDSDDQGERP